MDKEVKDLAKQIMQNAPKQSPHRNVKTEGQLIFGPYVPLCKVHDGLINGLLKINVDENPIIEDIEITGIKNKSFVENLSDSIVLKNRMSFTEDQLKKDLTLIKNILKVNGYYFAKIITI